MTKGKMATGLAMIALVAAGASAPVEARAPAQKASKTMTSAAARARADRIVAKMTRAEKIALVHGLFPPMAAGKTTNELIPSAGHIDGIPRLGAPVDEWWTLTTLYGTSTMTSRRHAGTARPQ